MRTKAVNAIVSQTESGVEIGIDTATYEEFTGRLHGPLSVRFGDGRLWGYFRSKPDDLAIDVQRVFDYFCDGTTHRDRELVTILMDTWAKLKIAKVDAKLHQINVYNCSNERASHG